MSKFSHSADKVLLSRKNQAVNSIRIKDYNFGFDIVGTYESLESKNELYSVIHLYNKVWEQQSLFNSFLDKPILAKTTFEVLYKFNGGDKKKLKEELKNQLKDEKIELHERFCSKHINAIPSDLNSHSPSLFSSSLGLSRTSNERRILRLVDAISDIDYSIRIHDTAKLWFKRWLKFHISISMILYVLIIFHITAEIYFGLRWL